MVRIESDRVVISIMAQCPQDHLSELQIGIIDLLQDLLSSGKEGKDLKIHPDTAYGGYMVLQLLKETLTQEHIKATSISALKPE